MGKLTLSHERLNALLTSWRSARDQKDATAERCTMVCCLFGTLTPNTMENQRSQAVLQHLFFSQTTVCNMAVLFSFDKLCVVHDASAAVELPAGADGFAFTALALGAGAEAEAEAAAALRSFLAGATVGLCQRELALQEGDFAPRVAAAVKAAVPPEQTVEVAPLIGEFLFVKDEAALSCVEKAAGLCNAVFRRFARGLIEEEIQKAQPRTLSAMREELSKKLEMPNTVKGLEALETSQYAIASGLTPCVMHRGTFKTQIQMTEASTQPLSGDVVVVRYGVKNSGYTAFFGRTLIFEANAPAGAKEAYQFAFSVSEKVMQLLLPGARLSDVYNEAMGFAQSTNAELATRLPKSLGFATGLLVLEARGTISEKGTAVVADGMPFVIRITLEAVPDSAGGESFDVELSDTVTVRAGAVQINTKTSRRLEEILYDAGEQEEDDTAEAAFEHTGSRELNKITRQGQSAIPLMSRESARDARLRELLHELHAELLAAGGKKTAAAVSEELRLHEIGRISYGDVVPFANESAFPAQARAGGIFVHVESEVAFFPVCGGTAAFHVATINKADVKQEGEYVTFTVIFHSLQEANVAYRLNRTRIFLKELNYRAKRDVFMEAKIAIQSIHQRIKNRDAERRRIASSAGSVKLNLIPNALRLPQIKIRPTATTGRQNKECVGNLELHQNGFRFSYIGGPPIDIVFENVKHIIFQPAVNSIRVIYHFTLKKVIEIARKNVDEVQFVADVMESSEGVTAVRRSYEEEVAAEEREQVRVSETNKQFMRFAQAVEKVSNLKTQIPVSNFSFEGVHSKGLSTFKANREVLWAISDRPPLTVRVMDVEVVSLERVIPGGSTFDMSLIFKDYNRTTLTITTIPRGSLEAIKDWCLASRLYYMESTVNPNWKAVLKTIMEDGDWDPWRPGAGWAVLNSGDDEDEEDEEGSADSDDSTYYEDEDEESDDTSSSFLEDEESDSSKGDSDDDESALSWDELERRAEAQDRKRGYNGDDDDNERAHKRPRTGAATAAPRMAPLPTRGKAPQTTHLARAVPPPRRF